MKKLNAGFASVFFFFTTVSLAGVIPNSGFTENKGQMVDQTGKPVSHVLFRGNRANAPAVFITGTGLTYLFSETPEMNDPAAEHTSCKKKWSRTDMVLENASIKKENVVASQPIPGYSNFYLAHCPGGILNVHTYQNVLVKNVYPGIDWNIYSDAQNKMEYDFIVHPGADPSQIEISYKGAQHIIPTEKSLQLISSCGSFTEGNLFSYEKESGHQVSSSYKWNAGEITFALGNYDHSKTIVIDPPLQWSSLQTGSGTEYAYAIALSKDGTGHTVVTGYSDSPDFPTLSAYQGTLSGPEDMVIVRLDASGNRVWSTYYGGSNIDGGKGIGTDLSGNAYVCGYTGSSNFPTLNPAQASYGGGTYDIVAVKLNASGVRQWATYYGGVGTDYGNALCADDNGNIYMTGYTASSNFPLVNAISTGSGQATDAFVMKMKPGGTVRWSDFFGNIDDDRGRAITINSTGRSE